MSSLICLKNLWIIDIESSLNIWYNFPVKSSVSGIFFVVRFFITNSISSPLTCYLNLGCCNRYPKLDGLNNKLLFLIVPKAESKIRVPACLMSWWDHSSWLADDFLFYPHMGESRERGSKLSHRDKDTNPIHEDSTLWPNYLWKALPPNTITLLACLLSCFSRVQLCATP